MTSPVAPVVPPGAQGVGVVVIDGACYHTHLKSWAAESGNVQLFERPGRLLWYSIRETTGSAAAQVRLINGSDDNAQWVASIELAQATSTAEYLGDHGIPCNAGLFLQTLNGTTEGVALYGEL